ncbi:hypothetical protein SAMN02910289_01086 [Lachnospiraceae bacterium RM5]|nr:hypothetical protein SAMN02910289_01086 [Lachnospiraceae bacterium RM5]
MAIPITIEKLLTENVVEWARIEFKEGWKKRRTKDQIKELILETLERESLSTNELYKRLGYSGNASKTFRNSIEELIVEEKIHYSLENAQDSNNVLIKD